ncbi:L7Ae/L30e/S12e/Gadd45 family ribosomal protein [Allofustis seminis]|uniref:L7Ae/L30e/S12e/Gadd45 family ribosomal protein n=1 Tax=Allofustis seminis TaxID=166939 RepID=UPI000363DE96|nr:ribosomal L7Ae/L30e/S12e/Gadd45 family protein [Allofustis seminis]
MKNKQKALNLLGLAMRARALTTGSAVVLEAIRSGKAKLVIIASDASQNTRKQFLNKCEYYKIPYYIHFTQCDISRAIGKERMVCAFTDDGFARSFKKLQM